MAEQTAILGAPPGAKSVKCVPAAGGCERSEQAGLTRRSAPLKGKNCAGWRHARESERADRQATGDCPGRFYGSEWRRAPAFQ